MLIALKAPRPGSWLITGERAIATERLTEQHSQTDQGRSSAVVGVRRQLAPGPRGLHGRCFAADGLRQLL